MLGMLAGLTVYAACSFKEDNNGSFRCIALCGAIYQVYAFAQKNTCSMSSRRRVHDLRR
jgi:hypothetical protein